jgi:hypothetical protein
MAQHRVLSGSGRLFAVLAVLLGVGCARSSEPETSPTSGLVEGGILSEEAKTRQHYDSPLRPPSSQAWSSVEPEPVETEEGLVRRLVSYSETYHIDRIYGSMHGPRSEILVPLGDPTGEPELLWIKGVHVEVVDEAGDPISQEFMCHVVASIGSLKEHNDFLGIDSVDGRFATLSQGIYQKSYPRSFARPVLSTDTLRFDSQVLNLNLQDPDARVRHRIVTLYIRDADLAAPMKPITSTYAQAMVLVGGEKGKGFFGVRSPKTVVHGSSCAMGRKADSFLGVATDGYGQSYAPHWIVEPGRVVYESLVTELMNLRHDTRIHSIDVHLHPFGEWIELRDLTTGETLFRSEARQVADGIGLESVQSYRSEEGIPVYRDHQYAIAASYDNTSGVESDAMAVMYLGLFDPEFDASLLGDPQALAAKRRQRDAERIAELERTIAADPQDQVAHTRLAVALMADNEVEKALHHIQVAARLDPDNTVISQVEAQILERAAPLQR